MRREICGECDTPINDDGSCICTELPKHGWRQCAKGQKVTQWCAMAETLLREQKQREAASAVQGEPVAYIRQEDFEFILADDKSEPYGTRRAPVFSRNDCIAPVPLYASPQPPAQDVEAMLRQALEALESSDWYIGQLEWIVYSPDDTGTHEERAKVQSTITALRERLGLRYEPEPDEGSEP